VLNTPNHSGVSRNADHRAQLLMSVVDGMRCLSIGRSKFYELVTKGEIELVKIGSKSCVVVSTIEAYIDRLRNRALPNKRQASDN
jgi:excisionase family DNA binding protein